RRLADRLNVKAASLYWHVRDRGELLELLADSILGRVAASPTAAWRTALLATAAALRAVVESQRDANRILLEVPDSLTRSATHGTLTGQLEAAGLPAAEASEVALMAMLHVIASAAPVHEPPVEAGSIATIAIDSGSRGVLVRPGIDMQGLIRTAQD